MRSTGIHWYYTGITVINSTDTIAACYAASIDYGRNRLQGCASTHNCTNLTSLSQLLTASSPLESVSSLFFLVPSSSPLWPLSGLLFILASIGFSASVIVLISYLPHPAASSLPSSNHSTATQKSPMRLPVRGCLLSESPLDMRPLSSSYWAYYFRFSMLGDRPRHCDSPSAAPTSSRSVAEEREGLLSDECQEAAPALAAEWTVRREVVDAWK